MKELRTNLSVILTNIMESNDLLKEKKNKLSISWTTEQDLMTWCIQTT